MNKEQLIKALEKSEKEISSLCSENEQLLAIVIDSTQHVISAQNRAENYQNMFDELVYLIKRKYDADFKIEDIPRLLD